MEQPAWRWTWPGSTPASTSTPRPHRGRREGLRRRLPDDGNGHGTHVAGTIGARDDEEGVVGVALGARLHAVKVLDGSGSGSWSTVLCGIDWVTANAATIETANMSLSGTGTEPGRSGCSTGDALHDAVCRSVAAGVTYVVAAGNDGPRTPPSASPPPTTR